MSFSSRMSAGVLNLPQVPSYIISRRADLSFEWDPPLGSIALANALGMKYPLEESLEKQIQRAILEFIESEKRSEKKDTHIRTTSGPPPSPNHTNATSSVSVRQRRSESFARSMNTWNVTTGEPVERKVRRASYNINKRRKVAKVRQYGACDFHRKQKTECTCIPSDATQRRSSNTDLKDSIIHKDSAHMGDLPTPAATPSFATPEEQNTLNITPSTSPSETEHSRSFVFTLQSSELPNLALHSTNQPVFWGPSPYLDTFDTHQPCSSTDASALISISNWQQPPTDPDMENWWQPQGA